MDLKKQKLILRIAFLLMLIGILLSHIPSLINPSFFVWLETIINYKALLTLSIFAILILLYLLFSQKLYSYYNVDSKNILIDGSKKTKKYLEKEHEKIIKNLSANDKLALYPYFQQQTKSLVLQRDGTLINLVENGILNNPFSLKEYTNKDTFVLNDWAWEYINKHKKKLGMKF